MSFEKLRMKRGANETCLGLRTFKCVSTIGRRLVYRSSTVRGPRNFSQMNFIVTDFSRVLHPSMTRHALGRKSSVCRIFNDGGRYSTRQVVGTNKRDSAIVRNRVLYSDRKLYWLLYLENFIFTLYYVDNTNISPMNKVLTMDFELTLNILSVFRIPFKNILKNMRLLRYLLKLTYFS